MFVFSQGFLFSRANVGSVLATRNSAKEIDILKKAQKEYRRRGRPAQKTQWSIAYTLRFMRWKVGTASMTDDLGGVSADLPRDRLPQAVLDWEAAYGKTYPEPPSVRFPALNLAD